MLIDRPSSGATSCRRFAAPHHRREGLVCFRPWHGQAALALSRRRSRQTTGWPMSSADAADTAAAPLRRSARLTVLRSIPYRRASSLIETSRTKCSPRNSAHLSTSSTPPSPSSITKTKPGSTDPRTPLPSAQRGCVFNRQKGGEFSTGADTLGAAPRDPEIRTNPNGERVKPLVPNGMPLGERLRMKDRERTLARHPPAAQS
jgi:hypothetical protein